ncbi:MAG: type IX secretion system membrane protein PorP/SprF [Bacteroidales bacterium]|nr:type IX secretion system membrane protein PorP/SprF [Bacteroidales bacterium]
MNLGRYICIVVLCAIVAKLGATDGVNTYPIRFSQNYACYPLTNPAMAGSLSNYEFNVGNKRLIANQVKSATYYFNGTMRYYMKRNYRKTPFSVVGLMFYGDREGQYLYNSKLFATYAWHGNLTSDIMFSGGFQIGLMNFTINGTDKWDKSVSQSDGAVGVQVYNHKFHSGLSLSQIFNSRFTPHEQEYKFPTFLNISGSYNLTLSEFIDFKPTFYFSGPFRDSEDYEWEVESIKNYVFDLCALDFNLDFTLRNQFGIGIGVHNSKYLITTLEFKNQELVGGNANIFFTYGFPVNRTAIPVNFAEIGIQLKMD